MCTAFYEAAIAFFGVCHDQDIRNTFHVQNLANLSIEILI